MKALREYIEQAVRESGKIPMDHVYIDTPPPTDWDGVAYLVIEHGVTAMTPIVNDGAAPQTTPVRIYSVSTDQWESEQLCRQVAKAVESKINEWAQASDCPIVGMVENGPMAYSEDMSSSRVDSTHKQLISEMNFNVIHHINL